MIKQVLTSFTQQNEGLIRRIYEIMYYFRGALTRGDAWAMTHFEREIAIDLLNKRFKEAQELIKHKISPSL